MSDNKHQYYIPGCVNLYAQIIVSGIKENDQEFLKSNWCKHLTEVVIEYSKQLDEKSKKACFYLSGDNFREFRKY